jgi:hypothetical protein
MGTSVGSRDVTAPAVVNDYGDKWWLNTRHVAVARGPVEIVREAAGGVSATFVLLTQMLTLGLIAYGALGPIAVESASGRRLPPQSAC